MSYMHSRHVLLDFPTYILTMYNITIMHGFGLVATCNQSQVEAIIIVRRA